MALEKKENPWIMKIAGIVVTIALAVSSYFLSETMDKIKSLDSRVHAIELSNASSNGTRFTSADFAIQKAFLDADKLQFEKRITKMEEAIPYIKDSLVEIKVSISELKRK